LTTNISFIGCSKSAWYSWIYFCSVVAFYIVAVNFCNTDFLYISLHIIRMFKIQFPKTLLIKLTNNVKRAQHCMFAMVGLRRELAHSLKLDYCHMWLLEQAFPLFFFFELILIMTPGGPLNRTTSDIHWRRKFEGVKVSRFETGMLRSFTLTFAALGLRFRHVNI